MKWSIQMHIQPQTDAPLFKLILPLGDNAWHGFESETVWVQGLSDRTLLLRNSPFFAKGLSNLNVVDAKVENNELVFAGVRSKGGHSTYRLMVGNAVSDTRFQERWKELAALGCTYESFSGVDLKLYTVDVPPASNVEAIYVVLQAGERNGIWDFEEGHFAGPV
jgi:Domain of unknown function (DUF4265)